MRLGVVMFLACCFALSPLARADEATEEPPPSPAPAFDPTLEAGTDIPAEQPASDSDAPLEPLTMHGFWGSIGLGGSAATKDRYFKTGGLDLALGLAYCWRRLRLGGELRYTFLGGFDDPSDTYRYRVDIGPLHVRKHSASGNRLASSSPPAAGCPHATKPAPIAHTRGPRL